MDKYTGTVEIYDRDELQHKADGLFKKSGLTQTQVATLLSVTQVAVSKALRSPDEKLGPLRAAIISLLGKEKVEGPYYIIRKQGEANDKNTAPNKRRSRRSRSTT